jgi:uncharacterized protein involved in outer membrane biogenesis
MEAPRRRRWPKVLGVLAGVLVIAAVWINSQLEPKQLAATVLGQAGKALQLKLGFSGTPDYAFRPEPRLVLPGFTAASLDGKVFLSAQRAEISLPWSTITGDDPVITRVQLDAPVLDLPGLQRWLASRPPAPFKLPTLSRGIKVDKGIVRAAGWSVEDFALELPHLKTGDPAQLAARGTYLSGDTRLPFELDAKLATPGLASSLELKAKLLMSQAAAEAGKPPTTAPVAIALTGEYAYADPDFRFSASKLAVAGNASIPSFDGKGSIQVAQSASVNLDAVLTRWPSTWPKLPAALAAKSEGLPLHLRYQGKRDFSDALSLAAARDDTSLEASLKWPELRQWLASTPASPLPPLQGKLKTPSLDFDGVQLEGVEVEIGDGDSAEATAP